MIRIQLIDFAKELVKTRRQLHEKTITDLV